MTAVMGREFVLPVRVYIEDTDAGGIVYYVNYLKFMERARTEMVRELGFERPELNEQGLDYVVRSVGVTYHRPARLDDRLQVITRLCELKRSHFSVEQLVYSGDELMAEAQVKVACINKETTRASRIPAPLADALAAALAQSREPHSS